MKKYLKILGAALLVVMLTIGILWLCGNIGLTKGSIELDARKNQQIGDDWMMAKGEGDQMVAMVFYPENKNDHTFSVYVEHHDLSFGYFFRLGGSNWQIEEKIAEFTLKGYDESAFLSMNEQQIARMEIDNGDTVKVTEIDPEKPFAFVLASNVGTVSFFDINGDRIETIPSTV